VKFVTEISEPIEKPLQSLGFILLTSFFLSCDIGRLGYKMSSDFCNFLDPNVNIENCILKWCILHICRLFSGIGDKFGDTFSSSRASPFAGGRISGNYVGS
jgi:hypothetical protein